MVTAAGEELSVTVFGPTPEIEAALKVCVEQIWATHEVEEATGCIRRDEIRRYIQGKLQALDEAQLSNEDFEKQFKLVDTQGLNKLTQEQAKELIVNIVKF